jgi:hypothetical protein
MFDEANGCEWINWLRNIQFVKRTIHSIGLQSSTSAVCNTDCDLLIRPRCYIVIAWVVLSSILLVTMHSIITRFFLASLSISLNSPHCTSSCSRAISQPGGVYICPEADFGK